MKAKNIRCVGCGSLPEIRGDDDSDEEGPWYVRCTGCGKESLSWAYQREAWIQWRADNQQEQVTLFDMKGI